MRPFLAKLNHEFCEQDFLDSPVWSTYSEPKDIETLAGLGFDRQEVEQVVALIRAEDEYDEDEDEDEYAFPLPPETPVDAFEHMYLGVRATTPGGRLLVGFVNDTAGVLCVFHDGGAHQFTAGFPSHNGRAAAALAGALGEEKVFPMQVESMVTGERRDMDYA